MANANGIRPSKLGSCTGCAKAIGITPTSSSTPYCSGCRRSGKAPSNAQHATDRRYALGCRCDLCRDYKAKKARARYANRKTQGLPAAPYKVAECITCGGEFNARKRAGGEYSKNCSVRCANIARNLGRGFKPRPPRKSEFRKRAERLARRSAAGTTGGNAVYVQGACIVCEADFMSRGAASRYCSKVCREKNRANKSYGLTWLDRMAMFARDGWSCQICSEPVDYTAEPQSDWYPTIDHVVPRSKGGGDELSNLRTAHRWCNSVRGDLSFYSDADLAA